MRTQTCPGQNRKRLAHHALKIRFTHVGPSSHALERGARFSLAKSEATQGTESVRIRVRSAVVGDAAVRRTIGVAEDQSAGDSALDDELTSVLGAVVAGAQRDECVGIVVAALGAKDDVVEIEKDTVAATRHGAASPVASENLPAHGRWDVLARARSSVLANVFTHVGGVGGDGADVLSIAARHLDDGGIDYELLSPALLPAAVAFAADGNRHLVAGSTLVRGTSEDVACHEKERSVFIEGCIRFAAELGHGFAEGCEGFSRDLHAQDVTTERGIGSIGRFIAWPVSCDELFDLPECATARGLKPRVLALGYRPTMRLYTFGPWRSPPSARLARRHRTTSSLSAKVLRRRASDRRRVACRREGATPTTIERFSGRESVRHTLRPKPNAWHREGG